MKNSKKYSQKIKNLYSALKRGGEKVNRAEYEDPVEALVYAVLSEHLTESAANRFRNTGRTYRDWLPDFRNSESRWWRSVSRLRN